MYVNEAAIQRARADGDIVLPQCRQQFIGFFNGRGEIGVGEKNVFAPGFLHAMTHAVAFAAVLAIPQYAKIWDTVGERCCDFGGAIV